MLIRMKHAPRIRTPASSEQPSDHYQNPSRSSSSSGSGNSSSSSSSSRC